MSYVFQIFWELILVFPGEISMKYIPPNKENGSLADVIEAMESSPTKKIYIRFLAVKLLFQYQKPAIVADFLNRDLRTIQRWVASWNEGGIDALLAKPVPGRPHAVPEDKKKIIISLLNDPEQADETHWTIRKIHGYIKKQLSLELGYSTLVRSIKEWGFRLKIPRPWPIKQDEKLREIFRQELAELLDKNDHEVWFSDETGVLGDPRPRGRWMKKGEKGKVPFSGLHLRSNVIGAVNPKTGELFSLIVSHMNSDFFQVFLNKLAEETKGRKVIMVLDNASWHKVKRLEWHNIEPKYLPPYSPDLNPIERLWLVMKARFFTDWITKDKEQLDDRVAEALLSFIDNPIQIMSICKP